MEKAPTNAPRLCPARAALQVVSGRVRPVSGRVQPCPARSRKPFMVGRKDESLFADALNTIARVDGLINLTQPTPSDDVIHDFRECFKLLLNGRDVYSHDPAGRTLHPTARKRSRCLTKDFTTFGCVACRFAEETRQDLVDPGCSLYSDPLFKREGGKYVGFVELLRSRHLVRFGTLAARRSNALLCVEEGTKEDESDPGLSTIGLVVQTTAARLLATGEGFAN